jgi:hypothetical protein
LSSPPHALCFPSLQFAGRTLRCPGNFTSGEAFAVLGSSIPALDPRGLAVLAALLAAAAVLVLRR